MDKEISYDKMVWRRYTAWTNRQADTWYPRLHRFLTVPAFPDSASIPTLSQCEFLLIYLGLVLLVLTEIGLLYAITEKMR